MANIGEQVPGPRVDGTGPTLTPRPRGAAGAAVRVGAKAAGPRGAGRGRTALQAGIPRAPAPRPLGPAPRKPRAGGTPGGVSVKRDPALIGGSRALTSLIAQGKVSPGTRLPTRTPRPTPTPTRTPARQLIEENRARRDALKKNPFVRFVQGLRGR